MNNKETRVSTPQIPIDTIWETLEGSDIEFESESEAQTQPLNKIVVDDFSVFEIAGMEFIKFPSANGRTPILARDVLFDSVFGNNNNLAESDTTETGILRRMSSEILPLIENAIGSDNVLVFDTDLTSLDGLKDYGTLYSKISLPNVDFLLLFLMILKVQLYSS